MSITKFRKQLERVKNIKSANSNPKKPRLRHIQEVSDESEKFIGWLLNYGKDKIKEDNYKNLTSSK